MRKQYSIGDSYEIASRTIDMINASCDLAGEAGVPIKFYHEQSKWFAECLYTEDEPRFEKHLSLTYGLVSGKLSDN